MAAQNASNISELRDAANGLSDQDRIIIFPSNSRPIRLYIEGDDGLAVQPCDADGRRIEKNELEDIDRLRADLYELEKRYEWAMVEWLDDLKVAGALLGMTLAGASDENRARWRNVKYDDLRIQNHKAQRLG